jgi:hypothetical protein
MPKTKKNWITPMGESVPESAISVFDKKKERAIEYCAKEAQDINARLSKFKSKALELLDTLYEERLRTKGFTPEEAKGNFTFYNYDKSVKVEVAVSNVIEFNDDINLAQRKLEEYVSTVTHDTNADIKKLVNAAFSTRRGGLDRAKVVSLFTLDITHPLWIQAMELIKTSMEVRKTKRYTNVLVRNEEGQYVQVQLNFSSL